MNEKESRDKWWTCLFDQLNRLAYQDLFLIWIGVVVLFGLLFFGLSYIPGEGAAPLSGSTLERFLNAVYYSVITATNTGYGDILPHGFSRFFAALEAVAGLFVFAVFITKLMSRRQDIALKEIHKLTFENTYHNFRESLHVLRKDFDLVIEHSKAKQDLPEDDYERMAVAYEQYANILNEVPTFYNAGGGFYTLDRRRENLMLEAVNRTFERIHHMLETLSAKRFTWGHHGESLGRLRELIRTAHFCVSEWQRRSPYGQDEVFEAVLITADRINAQIETELTSENKKTK